MALEDAFPAADFETMAATCLVRIRLDSCGLALCDRDAKPHIVRSRFNTAVTPATCACVGQAVNGVPACADGEVMNSLMRQTWNFTGSIVSDVRNTTTISTRDFRI